jgi:putative flippase GtrA
VTAQRSTPEKLRALIRFGLGGVVSATVAVGTTALLHEIGGLPERVAGAGGFAAALVVNFFVLRYFVFAASGGALRRQLTSFLATTGALRAVEFAAFYAVNKYLHLHYLLTMVLVLGISFLVKFLIYEGIVFAKHATSDANDSQGPDAVPGVCRDD